MPRVVRLVISKTPVGRGTDDDPARTLIQLHTFEGKLIAQDDSGGAERKSWFDADSLPAGEDDDTTLQVA